MTRTLRLAALLPALLAGGCATAAPAGAPAYLSAPASLTPDSAARLVDSLADEVLAAVLDHVPEVGTQLGIADAPHGALTDNSLPAQRAWAAREDAWHERVRAIDPALLIGRPEYVTYGSLLENFESSRQTRVCRKELWGINQLQGWQIVYPYIARVQPVGTPQARAAALARFGAFPRFIDTEIANLREGLRLGYSAPKTNVARVVQQVEGLIAPPANRSPFYAPAERDTTAAFRRDLEALIAGQVNPALRRYRDFLRDEYLPAAREAVSVSANTGGAECYRASVRNYTTLDLEPREVHELGLRQMEKIQGEMRAIAQRSFGTGDVPALLQRFRTDTAYTFRTREQVVEYSQAALERARGEMPKWFGRLPKSDVTIRPFDEFQEKSAPRGSYAPPSEDGKRPGTYNINTYQPEKLSRVGAESTAFHEMIPGHHLQVALAHERAGAHALTRYFSNSAFAEGWGLYSERLADEMGLFGSDLDRMGLLSNEAMRAARLVVDPGLHLLGWSRQQAIDYMVAHTAMAPEQVANEVDRYIVLPGQATAYMVGNLEIRRLREQAERELGPKFDVREFHDAVLSDGGVTLPMLRHKLERWIAAKR